MRRLLAIHLSLLGIISVSSAARADGDGRCYVLEEVNVPDGSGGDLFTSWYGVNDRGQAVGNYCLDPDCRAVGPTQQVVGGAVYNDRRGTFSTFTLPPPFNWVGQVSISDRGVIAGVASESEVTGDVAGRFLQSAPFIRDRFGNISFPPAPPNTVADRTFFEDINDRGEVAGWFIDNDGLARGFVYKNGAYTIYDVPGAAGGTIVYGINNRGDLVGESFDAEFNPSSFLAKRATRRWPGPVSSVAGPEPGRIIPDTLNERGEIVGIYRSDADPGTFQSFYNGRGGIFTVSFPGAFQTQVFGINNRGLIVGTFDGFSFGFVGRPGECDDDDDDDEYDDDDD